LPTLSDTLSSWLHPRPASAAEARAKVHRREKAFLLYPPVMFVVGLSQSSPFSWEIIIWIAWSLLLAIIWRRIWSGRIPSRWLGWPNFALMLVAFMVGRVLFQLLAALGVPHL
jgi:hypothetical protein